MNKRLFKSIVPFRTLLLPCLLFFVSAFLNIAEGQGLLTAHGGEIVDRSGKKVLLKGMGLGGWLLMEGYMLQVNGGYGQWKIKREMHQKGASIEEIESFFTSWRNNSTTVADITYLKSLGLNCVRLPMHYDLFLTSRQRAVRDNIAYGAQTVDNYVDSLSNWYDRNLLFNETGVPGFTIINNLLKWCRVNSMWVILDMHAVPGGQGADMNISDALVGLDLYNRVDKKGKKIYQLVLEKLWKRISDEYKKESRVAMYDLINEPNGAVPVPELRSIYASIIATIRKNDDDHLILLEGKGYGNEYTDLTPDQFPGQRNLVWNGHRYWLTNDPSVKDKNPNQLNFIANLVAFREKWKVPVWVGETGENSNHWIAEACKNLNDNNIGWCLWTHKRLRGTNGKFEQTASPMKVEYANIYTAAGRADLLKNIQFANCLRQRDVEDAMTRMVNDTKAKPFNSKPVSLPGKIYCADFDLGRNGIAYNDETFQKVPYNGSGWNNGHSYRNDGVDVQLSEDKTGNGVNLGWITYQEWVQYSVNVSRAGNYSINIRAANGDTSRIGAVTLKIDNKPVGIISIPSTGGWQSWTTIPMAGTTPLTPGNHSLQLVCDSKEGAGNLSWVSLTLDGMENSTGLKKN